MQSHLGTHGSRVSGYRGMPLQLPPVPPCTGPLDVLHGQRGLVLVDVANLFCGAKQAGYELSFELLAAMLRERLRSTDLHAFFARNGRGPGQEIRFQSLGYQTHQRDVGNCDNDVLFGAGALLATNTYDLVIAATGDGDLADDLARGAHALHPGVRVFTLGFAHSTAWRLHCQTNPQITGNILIGTDCLRRGLLTPRGPTN